MSPSSIDSVIKFFICPAQTAKIAVVLLLLIALAVRKKKRTELVQIFINRFHLLLLSMLIVIAFMTREGWVIWSPHAAPSAHTEDLQIMRHALDLYEGKGYESVDGKPTAVRPVGYPFFLSILYHLWGGENVRFVETIQVLLGICTIFILYCLGSALHNRVTGLISAALLAFSPTSIFSTKIILDEHLFLPLFLGGLCFLIADLKGPKIYRVIFAGLLLGMSAHFRTYTFAMGLVVFFVWVILTKNLRKSLLRGLLIQLVILSIAVPWAIRNYIKLGTPVLYTTAIGTALYFGNNPNINPSSLPPELGGDINYFLARNEVEQNTAGKRAAIRWIREHPIEFINKSFNRVLYHLGMDREQWIITDNFHTIMPTKKKPLDRTIAILSQLDQSYYAAVFILAVLGLFLYLLNYSAFNKYTLIVFTIIYYLSIIAVTLGHRKYRLVIEPLFYLMAALAFYVVFFNKNQCAPQDEASTHRE